MNDALRSKAEALVNIIASETKLQFDYVDEQFEKYFVVKGEQIHLRIYWMFDRVTLLHCTLVKPKKCGDRSETELSLYYFVKFNGGSPEEMEQVSVSSEDAVWHRLIRKYAYKYLNNLDDFDRIYKATCELERVEFPAYIEKQAELLRKLYK